MAHSETPGNKQVVDLLEAYLAIAREGQMGHIAIAMVGYPNQGAIDFAGEIALARPNADVMGELRKKLDGYIANWQRPPVDDKLDAGYVCYDLSCAPIGFDFLIWLVDAEMTRRREGAPGPLKVAFWKGADEARFARGPGKGWLDNVFRPLVAMIGAAEDDRALHGRSRPVFVPREIVAAAKAGEAVPRLRSAWPGDEPQGVVTITLREAAHWPHRNSDLGAWLRFAARLRREGHQVVVLRDTAKAFEPFGDFRTHPLASIDLQVRQKLYESAAANLFVSNGPAGLAMFGERPWLQFVHVEDEEGGYAPNTAKFWAENGGVAPGGQYPWSGPAQRLVWAPDTFEAIAAAWDEHIAPAIAAGGRRRRAA